MYRGGKGRVVVVESGRAEGVLYDDESTQKIRHVDYRRRVEDIAKAEGGDNISYRAAS